MDNHCHVAHNCVIGDNTLMVAYTRMGGAVKIGRNVILSADCRMTDNLEIGDGAILAAGTGVMRVSDLLPGQSARCVLTITVARCDPLATTVRVSGSSLTLTGLIQSRVGGAGGRSACRAAGSGVTG